MKKIRVALFDDNLFFRESVYFLLEDNKEIALTGTFENANQVLKNVRWAEPDVVLMDIDMPGTNGIDALRKIRKTFPEMAVMMLTDFDEDDKIIDSICSGANGYLLKSTSAEKIIGGIMDIHSGHSSLSPPIAKKVLELFSGKFSGSQVQESFQLSPREKDVLVELVNGHAYKVIANILGITYDTVRAHIKQIYRKMHVGTVGGAVSKALRQNVVPRS